MPAVKFIERLDLEQNSSFPDGHYFVGMLGKGRIEEALIVSGGKT